ncbi:MAG: hypothetical protein R3E39_12025 [Anaerolineae bacterium]
MVAKVWYKIMKLDVRFSVFLVAAVFIGAGCSALPGLRVLSGEQTAETAANQLVENSEFVMADKSGNTDPALTAAADRIEAASGNLDIIEIRKDLNTDVFTVYVLLAPSNATSQADQTNELRRAIELTWQGTIRQSEGSDIIKIVILQPTQLDTIDKGPSFVGIVAANVEISRTEATAYLNHRPNTVNDFVNLVADGKMTFDQPQSLELYEGQPNHPVFMLSQLQSQSQ